MSGYIHSLFTGRLELHLIDRDDETVGFMEFAVHMDRVDVWMTDRSLMVIDRDQFREWLSRPWTPLEQDRLIWFTEGSRMTLSIDHSRSHYLPELFVRQLTEHI
jgi:hypothetical protein